LTPCDRNGVHTLVIGCGKEIKYGWSVGVYGVVLIKQLKPQEVENLKLHGGGVLTPSDGYGAHTLVIGRGKEMTYGGYEGYVWGDIDPTVEAAGGGELEIVQRWGFHPQNRILSVMHSITVGGSGNVQRCCRKHVEWGCYEHRQGRPSC